MFKGFEFVASDNFVPHGYCLLWNKGLLYLHIASDAIITLSYFSIPFVLVYFCHKRRDLFPPSILILFAAFILACGTTHLVDIWTLWHPDYVIQGYLKGFTALISIITAVYLWPMAKYALTLPSHKQLQVLNIQLERRIMAHEQTHAILRTEVENHRLVRDRYQELNKTLENRVNERTIELQQLTELLKHSKDELKLSMEGASLGVWSLNVETQRVEVSETLIKIFDLASAPFYNLNEIFQVIHPEDQALVSSAIDEAIANESFYEAEYRVVWKDGAIHWISAKGRAYRDEPNMPILMRGICSDITQIKAVASERSEYLAQLEEADRRKDEFLALLAHELRNPLAPLSLTSHLLIKGDLNTEQLRWSYQSIERQVNHLTRLVDDLLDVSRISRGLIKLNKEIVDLRTVFDLALQFSLPKIEHARLELSATFPTETLLVNGDSVRLTQAISNLLNNSAKFTPPKGKVSIEVVRAKDSNHAIIVIKDNGIGIKPDSLHQVFDLFTQVKHPLSWSNDGLGIGLYLSQQLIKMHGGTIEAFSDGEAFGSTFTVTLPLLKEAIQSPPCEIETTTTNVSLKVLIVDDNTDAANALTEVLKAMGCTTKTAYNGEMAINMAEELDPDIILMDLGMPIMSGYETCRRMRQAPWGKHLFIAALTGWGQDTDKQKSTEAGFDEHFIKPIKIEQLETLLSDRSDHNR